MPILAAGSQAASWGIMVLYVVLIIGFMYFLAIKPQKKQEKKQKEEYSDNFVYEKIENEFKEIIGTNVSIKRKSQDKGKIEIEYYSTEDLERIIDLMKKTKNS